MKCWNCGNPDMTAVKKDGLEWLKCPKCNATDTQSKIEKKG